MLKLGIGTKIATGFGLLILIIMLLGALAIYKMSQVSEGASVLAKAYVPEVDVANEMERYTLEAMFQHQGFSYISDPRHLIVGNEALEKVDGKINTAKQLAAQYPQLVKLKQGLKVFEDALAGYRLQMTKTIGNKRAIAADFRDMDFAAEAFESNINKYLEGQYEAMKLENRAGATYDIKMKRLSKIIYTNEIILLVNQIRVANFKAQAMRNLDKLDIVPAKFKTIDEMLDAARLLTQKPENQEYLRKVETAVEKYKQSIDILGALIQSDIDTLDLREKYVDQLLKASRITASAGIDHTKKIANKAAADLYRASWAMIIGLTVALLLGITISFVISRMVIIPVRVTAKAVSIAARGDFTYKVREKHLGRRDELGQMLNDVQKMAESLSDTVRGVTHSASMVSNAASEISSGNQDLSQRTQEQASAIQETASSLEEMTASVRNNADNSRQANDLARRTAKMAQEGGVVVEQTIEAMAEVTESSRKISDIITVVNEIAFQTNLLALNAAVEAARAGEAGRGFAVVAGEVRNLAGRSANAAKEIQGLITDSQSKVEQGNELVSDSGKLLGDIINNVKAVADTVAEITAASQEQARGVDEVNKAVIQMDEVIQRNATLVEEAASSSEEMASAAQDLLLQMGQFHIEDQEEQTRAHSAPPQSAPLAASTPLEPAAQVKKRQEARPGGMAKKKPANSTNDDFFEGVDLEGFEEF